MRVLLKSRRWLFQERSFANSLFLNNMVKFNRCFALLLFAGCFYACGTAKNEKLDIDFSSDSTTIIIKNIDPVGMLKIQNGELSDSLLQQMVTVLESPAEDDSTSVERSVPGKLLKGKDFLSFQPAVPFKNGRQYMVLTYLNSKFADLQSIIKNQTKFAK